MSGMWKQLTKDLGIDLGTSTAHRPQTDGQVERFNKTLEEMLRSYVNTSHNDWDVWLDCAEFAANKAKAAATGFCPFELVYQHTPMSPPERMLENSLNPLTNKDKYGKQHFNSRRLGRKAGCEWWCRLRDARSALYAAKDRMKDQVDKNRKERSFDVGDYVLLSTKYLKLKKPSVAKKFCPSFVGPFQVLERIGRAAYRIKTPTGCRLHDVIHVSKLWKYHASPEDDLNLSEPLWLEGEDLPEVTDILRSRGSAEDRHYLVQYKNRDCMYCTWEPEKSLMTQCSQLIEHYKARRTERDPNALSFCLLTEKETERSSWEDHHAEPEVPVVCYARQVTNTALDLQMIRDIPVSVFYKGLLGTKDLV